MLAGDLGATKTILAIFSSRDRRHGSLEVKSIEEFSSRDHSSFREVVQKFLMKNAFSKEHLVQATFGIAGPVIRGRSKLTNLDWELDEARLSEVLEIHKVKLLNDLEATANYIPFLKENERKVLREGQNPSGDNGDEERGSIAIIAPGTGLGEAYLTWDGERYRSHASEGGHSDYAPTSEIEDELLHHLRKKFGHVSYELVCSGKGIYNVWSYFHGSARWPHPESFCPTMSKMSKSVEEDPTPAIVDAIMKEDNDCVACRRTLDTFVSALGAESGNLALKFLATDGVYLAGGLTELILPALTDDRFARAYLNKGRMSKLVSEIPVTAILTRNSALLGAAHYALDSLELFEEEEINFSQEREEEEGGVGRGGKGRRMKIQEEV